MVAEFGEGKVTVGGETSSASCGGNRSKGVGAVE